MKVVLCGPPRSGKSCLRQGLKDAIRRIDNAVYPYVITACPDGEGAWFQEAVNRDPALAAECKAGYKSTFTPEYVKRVADSVSNCSLPLTLVDIGGRVSAENEVICDGATHAIILAGELDRLADWREFCAKVGLVIIAEIHSDYNGNEDTVPTRCEDGVHRGAVHHLERGETAHQRPTIMALAEILVQMVGA